MAKVKRKKLRVGRFLIFLLLVAGVLFLTSKFLDNRIKNIVVNGNDVLSEKEIVEISGLSNYPSFFKTTTFSIKKRLMKNPIIKKVKVRKRFYNKIEIDIVEKKLLYLDEQENRVVLEDKTKIANNNSYSVPILVNYIPNTKYNQFIKKLNKIHVDVLKKVSEITYSPTELDDGRFLLSMTDSNYVYLTLTKFDYLNYYDDMLPKFNGRKGILYLDSGNTFKIME